MASRATLRASDADRDRVIERLRQAAAEGRLLTEELEKRLEAALSARTYGQLDALLADLPGRRLQVPQETHRLAWVPPALGLAIAIPTVLAVLAVVVLALAGVLAMWWLWLLVGWWFFGHPRRRIYGARYRRSLQGCGHRRASRVRTHPSRAFRA
ncbi:MAG TPA: DUF1707 domain-containing protein [Solirubrobacteraceae bacterium]|nr:DUF1707 domain-containing protein [Solirubrobacteraceae bacterium]